MSDALDRLNELHPAFSTVGDKAERIRKRKQEEWNKCLDAHLLNIRIESANRMKEDTPEYFYWIESYWTK